MCSMRFSDINLMVQAPASHEARKILAKVIKHLSVGPIKVSLQLKSSRHSRFQSRLIATAKLDDAQLFQFSGSFRCVVNVKCIFEIPISRFRGYSPHLIAPKLFNQRTHTPSAFSLRLRACQRILQLASFKIYCFQRRSCIIYESSTCKDSADHN